MIGPAQLDDPYWIGAITTCDLIHRLSVSRQTVSSDKSALNASTVPFAATDTLSVPAGNWGRRLQDPPLPVVLTAPCRSPDADLVSTTSDPSGPKPEETTALPAGSDNDRETDHEEGCPSPDNAYKSFTDPFRPSTNPTTRFICDDNRRTLNCPSAGARLGPTISSDPGVPALEKIPTTPGILQSDPTSSPSREPVRAVRAPAPHERPPADAASPLLV
jgi:hypothetical protein